jgi:hypothetical protein
VTYVLVSLLGDEATAANDVFARWFEASHPPVGAFHEEHPDPNAVADAVRATPTALVFGHDGGGSLRGAKGGSPWVNAQEFAQLFAGSRVWVYACDTRAQALEDDLLSLGRQARSGGVTVFVGHCTAITAVPPYTSLPALRASVYHALARAFRCFIQGQNNALELRRAALKGAAFGRATALTASPIERDMASLRVLA